MADLQMRFGLDMLTIEGGFAPLLSRYNVSNIDCPELLNVTEPETIEQIHRLYHIAGANCAVSNTYGASRLNLKKHNLDGHTSELNQLGVRLAKNCNPQHVLANMGPCAIALNEASSDDERAAAYSEYLYQAQALASAEPDAIFIQTMANIKDAECAVLASREACNLPVICTCVFDEGGSMLDCGTSIEDAVFRLEAAGADVVGMNCNLNPQQMAALAPRMVDSASVPVMAMPDVKISVQNPSRAKAALSKSVDQMAVCAEQMMRAGVQMIGSCCGSVPSHTGAIYAAIFNKPVTHLQRIRHKLAKQ